MRKEEIGDPPDHLAENEVIVKVMQIRGNTFDVIVPESHLPRVEQILGNRDSQLLVSLNPSLRNKFFIKRNGIVVASLEKIKPNNKVSGEISNFVADVRFWERNLPEWPAEFKSPKEFNSLDLPPTDDSDEESEEEKN